MLARERTLLLLSLLGLATVAWTVLVAEAQRETEMGMASSLTMGANAPLFLTMWVAMMVAIMLPTAAPMILTFATVQAGKRRQGQAFVPTWIFVSAYLLVWSLTGVAAYAAAAGAEAFAQQSTWLMDNGGRIGGALLVLAGIYQLSPLKRLCLAKCRTPLTFIMTSWRDGADGAFRMGLAHGWYCLGCCWLLFAILFPLGVMNVIAMVLLTALIFAEKTFPTGQRVAQGTAAVLVVYGVAALLMPEVLPTVMPPAGAPRMPEMGM